MANFTTDSIDADTDPAWDGVSVMGGVAAVEGCASPVASASAEIAAPVVTPWAGSGAAAAVGAGLA